MLALCSRSLSLNVSIISENPPFLFFSFLSKPSNRDYFSPLGRAWPLSFGSGLGLGMGYSNCQHDFRSPYLIHGRMVKVSAQCNFHCLSEVCDTRSHHAAWLLCVHFSGPVMKDWRWRGLSHLFIVMLVFGGDWVFWGFFCCTGINLQWCPHCVYKTLNIYLIKSLWEKALSPRFFCANVREEWSVVWGWEVILCVNELGDSSSCCFGMRARFSICSPLGEWEDEKLCRMVK